LEGKQILSASDDGTVRLGQCGACNDTIDELRVSERRLLRRRWNSRKASQSGPSRRPSTKSWIKPTLN
jgi:hypothetical protein